MKSFAFDVIVVGGGPAGISAAIVCARAGLSTVLLERGRFCGAKNLFGGVVYTESLLSLFPELFSEKRLPFERPVTEEGWWILWEDSVVKVTYRGAVEEPPKAFTAFRAKFDPWFSQKASEAGVLVVPKVKVVDVIKEGDFVKGVMVDRPSDWDAQDLAEVRAPVTVIAEGVNRVLTQKAGLVSRDFLPEEVVLSVKEVIQPPKGELERRLGIREGEGLAVELVGEATLGLAGSGFLYTNSNSISLGVGLFLDDLSTKGIKPYELLEHLKGHPAISRVCEGAEVLEYGAHLIPEWGFDGLPSLYGNGVLVVGDAAGLVNPLFREGTNLAIYSGIMAAKTAIFAHEKGDFSSKTLRLYEEALRESYIYKDLKRFRKLKKFLKENSYLFSDYPELLNRIFQLYASSRGRAKEEVFEEAMRLIKRKRGVLGLLKDLFKVLKFVKGW